MINDRMGIGSPYERELHYYRRECNDLGARLLRLQEEQSQAFLEARRSRTVVRLVREAYRLAEPTQAADDVGGALLQVVVENALCDRAALLREEPSGSGRFLVAHAIGGTSVEADEVITIPNPPRFYFTSSVRLDRPPAGLLEVLRLPFMLWAYDQSSGHALAIGNRSEGNVSRPFESGDQELIEAALSVYLDVLYRKHAEAQLRQAKQVAEEASLSQVQFLEELARQLRPPIERILALSDAMTSHPGIATEPKQIQIATKQLSESSQELTALANEALQFAKPQQPSPRLDVEWIDLGGVVRRVFRSSYPVSVKEGIELQVNVPQRDVSICVDRDSMNRALQAIVNASLARTLPGSTVKLSAGRRGDGAVEILVSSPTEALLADLTGAPVSDCLLEAARPLSGFNVNRLAAARQIVEAHGGILVIESQAGRGSQARVILPVHITRDETGLP